MNERETNEANWGIESSLCDCENCKGGVSQEEDKLIDETARRLLAIAAEAMPERMGGRDDDVAWVGSVVQTAFDLIIRQTTERIMKKGAPAQATFEMMAGKLVGDALKPVAQTVQALDETWQARQLALVELPKIESIELSLGSILERLAKGDEAGENAEPGVVVH